MRVRRRQLLNLLLLWLSVTVCGQPRSTIVYYDEEDGLPHGHVTQLLQDELGFMWFATWNGLCRYDGYEFRTFKPATGDGCHMATDRFRDIALCPDGRMVCRVDDDYYWFNTHTYRFSNMTDEEARQAPDRVKQYRQAFSLKNVPDSLTDYIALLPLSGGSFALTDRQGILWVLADNGVYKVCKNQQHTERLDITPKGQVKCLFTDRQQRYWVATKDDTVLRVYSGADDRLLGYLGADGRLHSQYTRFGAAVYCMYQSADGTLWLGTKPDGLFRLQETSGGEFKIDHFNETSYESIYHIAADGYGRLWLATLGGGLCYVEHVGQPASATPRFAVPANYPKDVAQRVRYLLFAQNGRVLMAATTDGLVVSNVEQDVEKMRFHRHFRESDRSESLTSSATMDIMGDDKGRYYVSTESGGVNRIETDDLLADQLTFSHLTAANHRLPSDVALSLTQMGQGKTMVVSSHLVTLVDSTGHYRQLDARYFNDDFRFSDAHPQPLRGDRWLFGLTDGAFITSVQQMYQQPWQPTVVLTGISIQGGDDHQTIVYADSLVLQPDERSLTIRFAALDMSASERISYAFRLLPNEKWNYVGHDRSATLLDLPPGTYLLEVRSTDTEGQWLDNTRRLTIVVCPTFWEAWYGQLLLVLLILCTVAAIVYTYLYIKRIQRQHKETLEAYLALMERPTSSEPTPNASQREGGVETSETGSLNKTPTTQQPSSNTPELDPVLKRVMQFLEEHLSNADIGVGDMAAAAATSRSGLQRKLKQAMGITPQDLLREARIKHACQLLRTTDRTVAEVAYGCGFTDPKYFSRCFKQGTGLSPSEYKTATE